MKVEVKLYANFRDYLPKDSHGFSFKKEITVGATVADLAADLNLPENIPKIYIIKGSPISTDHVLQEDDVISIFPPIAGG